MIGSRVAAATERKWNSSSCGVGTYTIAGNTMRAVAPIVSASLANAIAAAVVSSETPAMIGTRPPAASTAVRSTERFSSAVRELFSPHVPEHDEAMHALLYQGGLHRAGGGEIDPQVGIELGGHRREHAGPGAG